MSKVVLISVATSVGLGLLSVHLVKQRKEGEATISDLKAQVESLQEQQQRGLCRCRAKTIHRPKSSPRSRAKSSEHRPKSHRKWLACSPRSAR